MLIESEVTRSTSCIVLTPELSILSDKHFMRAQVTRSKVYLLFMCTLIIGYGIFVMFEGCILGEGVGVKEVTSRFELSAD